MAILSDGEIIEALEKREIIIDPPLPDPRVEVNGLRIKGQDLLQPATIDLRLGSRFGRLHPGVIDRYGPNPVGPKILWHDSAETFALHPLNFVICSTFETVTLKSLDLVGVVCGKSTLARDGLQVEAAGLVDPGWSGKLTLELFNMGPATIVLRPGQPIAQIYFLWSDQPALRSYGHPVLGSHYQGAVTTEAGYDPTNPTLPIEEPRSRSDPARSRPRTLISPS